MTKAAGVTFVKNYEDKHGAGTRTPFAAHLNDGFIVLQTAIPAAVKVAQPGTDEFREALKVAVENLKELPASQGVYNYAATDHDGLDERARVLVVVKDGAWRYLSD
jgi:branched-chain amino acid transport system substrate-binding protein